MKKTLIIILIIAGALILIGGLVFGAALIAARGDLAFWKAPDRVSENYTVTESFDAISAEIAHGLRLVCLPSGEETCRIEYEGEERGERSVRVENGTLVLEEHMPESSFFRFQIAFGYTESFFTVYLPKDAYRSLSVKTVTGDLTVPETLSFGTAKISGTTGDVLYRAQTEEDVTIDLTTGDVDFSASVGASLSLKTTTGGVKLSHSVVKGGAKVKTTTGSVRIDTLKSADLTVSCTTGDARLTDALAEGNLQVKVSTGDIVLTRCDAPKVGLETSTGEVRGSLRTGKVFTAHSSTGRISVPKDDPAGGECSVSTATGGIRLTIENA